MLLRARTEGARNNGSGIGRARSGSGGGNGGGGGGGEGGGGFLFDSTDLLDAASAIRSPNRSDFLLVDDAWGMIHVSASRVRVGFSRR